MLKKMDKKIFTNLHSSFLNLDDLCTTYPEEFVYPLCYCHIYLLLERIANPLKIRNNLCAIITSVHSSHETVTSMSKQSASLTKLFYLYYFLRILQ